MSVGSGSVVSGGVDVDVPVGATVVGVVVRAGRSRSRVASLVVGATVVDRVVVDGAGRDIVARTDVLGGAASAAVPGAGVSATSPESTVAGAASGAVVVVVAVPVGVPVLGGTCTALDSDS